MPRTPSVPTKILFAAHVEKNHVSSLPSPPMDANVEGFVLLCVFTAARTLPQADVASDTSLRQATTLRSAEAFPSPERTNLPKFAPTLINRNLLPGVSSGTVLSYRDRPTQAETGPKRGGRSSRQTRGQDRAWYLITRLARRQAFWRASSTASPARTPAAAMVIRLSLSSFLLMARNLFEASRPKTPLTKAWGPEGVIWNEKQEASKSAIREGSGSCEHTAGTPLLCPPPFPP